MHSSESSLLSTLRYISIFPSLLTAFIHLSSILSPTSTRSSHCITVLWAIITAYHLFSLTTGLLHRWLTYYPPIPHSLIRLLALQAGIIWPAQHFVLRIFSLAPTHMAWCVVGTIAAVANAIQLWATSELRGAEKRKWEWDMVLRKCVAPAAGCYFVMAWWLMLAEGGERRAGC